MPPTDASAPSSDRARAFLIVLVAYLVALVLALLVGIGRSAEHPIIVAAVADAAATLVVFAFSFAFRNSSFYDPYWSVAPFPIALYWALVAAPGAAAPSRQILVLFCVALWGVRLTWNWARGWTGLAHEDWRYVDMRAQSGGLYWPVSFLAIHFFPTLIVFVACLPLWPALASGARPLGALDALGAALCVGGTALELFADNQLRRFRRDGPPPEAILETGLWAWSRHPNYLGEILFWVSLWLFAIAADPSSWWWTAIGPVAMIAMFAGASIPMMDERSAGRRSGWSGYASRTPALWPRRPR
jgi:steroid 5-alpha reductase family enzyme